jgi:phosphate/sulfate permease
MVIMLFFLAAADLVVGVSNDAVNFLNAARGARAAKKWIIMTIASLGVFIGATFSSGMMEVARSGIFHPEQFVFSEIMIIYLAVMLTDIILLDTYNTLGLPTSTTVSIVFELLGASVAIALLKIYHSPEETLNNLSGYINSDKALVIISGILLSVIIAFTVGALVQYLTRLFFTFKYDKKLKRYGALWGGLCISIITYFILIKGADGSSFMTREAKDWINSNTGLILGGSFLGWTLVTQIARWLFKANIPRMVILFGTFALAFAFAGNDLVNFIGVPLAGFKSYQVFAATPGADPDTLSMAFLAGKVQTETYLLLLAGLIMVVTLWFSKKATHVSKTELGIARHNTGDERFGSSSLSRSVVRAALLTSEFFHRLVPVKVRNKVNARFSRPVTASAAEEQSFDMIRASMNLTVASSLIAMATSLGLPLSTTYVIFMVSMGTTLADRAWGRESAVYRVTGVFTVIGGWFLTAIMAFTVSMLFAVIIFYGKLIAIAALFLFAVFLFIKRFRKFNEKEREEKIRKEELEEDDILSICNNYTTHILDLVPEMYGKTVAALHNEDRKTLKSLSDQADELLLETKNRKNSFTIRLPRLEEENLEYGHFYLQMLHYIREFSHSLNNLITASHEHVDNNHCGTIAAQHEELIDLHAKMKAIFNTVSNMIREQNFEQKEPMKRAQQKLLDEIVEYQRKQIDRIKNNETSTRNAVLYMSILTGSKDMLIDVIRLLKVQSKFYPEVYEKKSSTSKTKAKKLEKAD